MLFFSPLNKNPSCKINFMSEFSEEEKMMLTPFVSNLDKHVFVLKNLPEVVKGALFSRYSRSSKSLRRVLLDEFMKSEESGIISLFSVTPKDSELIHTQKAEEFYDRVLVGYGDDSVAELAGAHIALEDISIIATKIVEDARIGISPLEKSTRYVYFDKKRDGKWLYKREKTLVGSEFAELYEQTCDLCFQTYADLVPKISKLIIEKEPKDENTSDRAYNSAIRAKTCDILRGLLPASTLTNMGMFGNGRAYEYLLTKMYSDDLAEISGLAEMMETELRTAIPAFVKRANNKHGIAMQNHYKKIRSDVAELASKYDKPNGQEEIVLVDYDKDAEDMLITAALYPLLNRPMKDIFEIAKVMGDEEKQTVISSYISERENRRQKPGRAFEHCTYTFELCSNYGGYRDMHRHRVLTQQRQLLTPYHGYKLPKEIVEAGYEKEFARAMNSAKDAYLQIAKKYKKQAQYVIPLAYNIRWYMRFSLREAYHMLELRSARQGHVDYRRLAQGMFKEIERVHPQFAKGMKFMDMEEHSMERLEAEQRIDKKMDEIKKKYGEK